ncbi:MAG: LysR substrate-binding domain-containing protein, partial [Acidimicrobiales bacterium]
VVAASSIPGTFLLPPILGRFHQAHPGVSLRLEISDTAEVERRLLELEADLGVMGEPISPGDLEVRPWVDDELVLIVVGDHPWTRRKPRRAEALAGRPFIAREPGSSVRALTDAWLAALGIQVDVTMELNSPEAVNRAVAAGLGVSITSRFALEHEVPSGELAIVNVPGLPIRRKLNVITNRHRPLLPATGALLQAILASGRTAAGIDSGVHL